MTTELELKTEPVIAALGHLDTMARNFLRHIGAANVTPLCRGHAQSISLADEKFTGVCLDTPYDVRWRAVVVAGLPALQEFEFTTQHEGKPVVLTRIYLGTSGKLSLDSDQLLPLCNYDDPEVAQALASLVLTGLMSSVIYAPRDRVYDAEESKDATPDAAPG